MCTLLGSRAVMVLRQTSTQKYQVVGSCYIHGLQDGDGVLGPLPQHWILGFRYDSFGTAVPRFVNTSTNKETIEDPRLEPLPETWECLPPVRSPGDPHIYARYRNKETQEVMNSDPRMLPDALRARGVPLETFTLV